MHVVTTRRRYKDRVYEAHLLRRTYREGGAVKNETVGNLSHLPAETIELVRRSLRGERFLSVDESFAVEQSLPHGHVEAALAMARRLELARLLDRAPSRERSLCLAMLVERVLQPASKLATARGLADSTLAAELGVEGADEDDLYRALDWLSERQGAIERRLARRHLRPGEQALYDVSSSYFEGRSCPLAQLGYSRDRRRGSLQLLYGLLCDRRGRPLAVEVFPGSLHDDQTVPDRLAVLRERFGCERLVLCVDRGMVTEANLDAIGQAGFAFISALRAPQVKRLAKQGALQLSLLDQLDLAEIESDDFPGERLVVCRNPLVGQERSRKREALLQATEAELEAIAARVERGTLAGEAEIGLAVGAVWNRHRVKKHFRIEITDQTLRVERRKVEIAAEAALDGIYILRTTVSAEQLPAADVVRSYKQLSHVERAHRSLKGPDLELRPIHHRLEERVRAHVFLCTLAYYLEWHLRYCWRELLYADEHPPLAADPVKPSRRSPQAERKARRKKTDDGDACHSWPTLLRHLALRSRNTIRLAGAEASFAKISESTPTQARALELVQATELPA
ncbi:MAG: IS1634 family transposase [Actinobacteria bacterium]|nr:IS1634 family transposase [Actinomycetota bacterium]